MEHIGGRLQVSAHAPDFVRQKKRQKSWPGHYLHTYSKRASDTKRMWIFLARTDGMDANGPQKSTPENFFNFLQSSENKNILFIKVHSFLKKSILHDLHLTLSGGTFSFEVSLQISRTYPPSCVKWRWCNFFLNVGL